MPELHFSSLYAPDQKDNQKAPLDSVVSLRSSASFLNLFAQIFVSRIHKNADLDKNIMSAADLGPISN